MSTENSKPSFGARLMRFLVRALFILVVGAILGGIIYFGAMQLYQQYVNAVQTNDLRLAALETQQEQRDEYITERLESFQSRIDTLEANADDQKQLSSALQTELEAAQQILSDVENVQAGLVADIVTLNTSLTDAQTALGDTQTDTDELTRRAETLSEQLDELSQAYQTLGEQLVVVDEAVATNSANWDTIQNELRVLRLMELLTRSRLYLSQGNTSLARADIQAGREIVSSMQTSTPSHQAQYIASILQLLDESLVQLRTSPLAAADRMEGAWALLVTGLPSESDPIPTEDTTPTPTP